MFWNGEWSKLDPKAVSTEKIDWQIGELTPQWEQAQDDLGLSRRLARLWEERFELEGDEESFNGTLYFHQHLNAVHGGSDPSILRKLGELRIKQLDLHIKPLEAWIGEWGSGGHEGAAQAREQLAVLKKEKSELQSKEEKEQMLSAGKAAESRVRFW